VPDEARNEHVLGGAEELAEPLLDLREHGGELWRPVVDDGLRQRRQHLGRDRRRSRSEQIRLDHEFT
jgi:hypothetical protein